MEGVFTTLLIIGIVLLVIGIVIFAIKRKLNSLTKQYLNKNLTETAQMISKGLKEETTLPKPVTDLTAAYRPQIDRDFPGYGYQRMETMAKQGLLNTLNAIESEDASDIPDASPVLAGLIEGIIGDNRSKNLKVFYDNAKIHKTAISRYKSNKQYADAVFEISCQYNYYCTDAEGKIKAGSKTELTQAAYRVKLSYNQNVYDEKGLNSSYTRNCPNCGAPVSVIGGNSYCEYCGSGVKMIEDRIWQINSVEQFK